MGPSCLYRAGKVNRGQTLERSLVMKDLGCHTREVVFSPENQGKLLVGSGTIGCVFLKAHCTHHLENILKEAGREGWLIVRR